MLLALLLMVAAPDWVPMRWSNQDTKSLELLKGTPINCLLLEKQDWSAKFVSTAKDNGIATLGVIHPGASALTDAQQLAALKMDGAVLEGDFETPAVSRYLADSRIATVDLPSRSKMKFDGDAAVIGTYQGVWPGVQVEES